MSATTMDIQRAAQQRINDQLRLFALDFDGKGKQAEAVMALGLPGRSDSIREFSKRLIAFSGVVAQYARPYLSLSENDQQLVNQYCNREDINIDVDDLASNAVFLALTDQRMNALIGYGEKTGNKDMLRRVKRYLLDEKWMRIVYGGNKRYQISQVFAVCLPEYKPQKTDITNEQGFKEQPSADEGEAHKTESDAQKTEIASQKTEIASQKTEITNKSWLPSSSSSSSSSYGDEREDGSTDYAAEGEACHKPGCSGKYRIGAEAARRHLTCDTCGRHAWNKDF